MLFRRAEVQDLQGIAKVHIGSWRTSYAEILPADFLASLSVERSEKSLRGFLATESQVFIYVAETDAPEIVGFVCAGPEREGDRNYRGEIYAIYLLQNYQRQGIGSRLFKEAARELRRQQMTSLLVWVLAENSSARRFYEALGGIYLRQKDIEIGGQQLIEVAYGWEDTQGLCWEPTSAQTHT